MYCTNILSVQSVYLHCKYNFQLFSMFDLYLAESVSRYTASFSFYYLIKLWLVFKYEYQYFIIMS